MAVFANNDKAKHILFLLSASLNFIYQIYFARSSLTPEGEQLRVNVLNTYNLPLTNPAIYLCLKKMLHPSTLKFLKDISKNNNREWFETNRNRYQAAKNDFEQFIAALLKELTKVNKNFAGLAAKDCVFRIYRDVRFSKDKTPYKSNLSASIKEGGKKGGKCGIYIHVEPGGEWGNMIAGGYWQPEAPLLKSIRQEIEYHTPEFKSIISNKDFKKWFGKLEEEKLKNAPKGIDKEHPDVELFKYTSYIISHQIKTIDVTSKTLIKECVAAYKVMKPFLDFLNRAVS